MRLAQKIFVYLFLFILSVSVSLEFMQNPWTHGYYELDSSIYSYIGKLITEGHIPYRDVFDHKGPLVYLWYALGYWIYPMTGQWLLEILCLFAGLVLIYQTGRKYIADWMFLIFSLAALLAMPVIDTIGNTESLSFLPIFFVIYAFERFLNQGKVSSWDAFFMGVASSCLLLIKPTHTVAAGSFVLYITGWLLYHKKYRDLFFFLIYGGIGFLLPIILSLGWLWKNNAIADFWQDYCEFNFFYMDKLRFLGTYWATIKYFIDEPLFWLAVISVLIVLINFKEYGYALKQFICVLIFILLVDLWLVIMPCNPHNHYIAIIMPIVLVLMILAFKMSKMRSFFGVAVCLFIICRVPIVYNKYTSFLHNSSVYHEAIMDVSAVIKKYAEDGDKISSFTHDYGAIYLYSEHDSNDKYFYIGHLYRLLTDKVYEEFRHNQPKIFVGDRSVVLLPWIDFDQYIPVYGNRMLVVFVHK